MDYKGPEKIESNVTTETKPGIDPTKNPAPHPAGRYVQDQIAAAEAQSGIGGGMDAIRDDLSGGAESAMRHIDYTGHPQFHALLGDLGQWAAGTGLAPEQAAGFLGQALAKWCADAGGMQAGIACLHQLTAYLGEYTGMAQQAGAARPGQRTLEASASGGTGAL